MCVHYLSTQAAAVADVLAQAFPFPESFKQVAEVPNYYAHVVVPTTHPRPLVIHPFKKVSQSASVVATPLSEHYLVTQAPDTEAAY